MLTLKRVPAAEWASQPFLGPQIVVIDEQERLGSWDGSAYVSVGGAAFVIASQAEAEAGTDNAKGMTPLRVAQAIAALGSSYLGTVADEAAMIALTADAGDEIYRTDTGTYWKLRIAPATTASNWSEVAAAAVDQNAPVATVVAFGASSFEGFEAIRELTEASCERTSNVLTVVASSAWPGTNAYYVGQKIRLMGLSPPDLNGVFEKVTTPSATQFTVASIGPDIALTAIGNATANIAGRTRDAQTLSKCSAITWAIWLSHGRMRLLANESVPSMGWAHAKTLVGKVLAHQPTRVVVELGANDLTTVGVAATEAQAVMDAGEPVLDALRAGGVQIDLCGIKPLGAAASGHAAFNERAPLVNAHYQAYAALHPEQIHYVNTYGAVVSDIGSGEMGMAAGLMQADGIHDRPTGALKRGQTIANHWSAAGAYGRRYHPTPIDGSVPLYLGFNVDTAGGTNTNSTGDVPAGWTLERTAGTGTVVGSIVSRGDGTFAARAEVQGAGGALTAAKFMKTDLHAYMPKGSKWRIVFDFAHTNSSDSTGNALPIGCTFRSTVSDVEHRVYTSIDVTGLPTTGSGMQDCAGRYVSHEFQIPNTGAGTHTACAVDISFGAAGTSAALSPAVVEIGDIHLVRVG